MVDSIIIDLAISRIPGLRGNEKIELLEKFDYNEGLSALTKKKIEQLLGKSLKPKLNIDEVKAGAEKDEEAARKLGISIVSFREERYPPLLREIYDPPILLFFRGILPDPQRPLAAIVGTRKPSSLAAGRAFKIGKELGEAGVPVVSGLALGIDSMAHRGNIEGRAPTVAVLGSGPDLVYPSSNRPLARQILLNGGLLISEYPPGTVPYKSNFPARNRIISALARGVLIIEAPVKSGALITAAFALEQGRDLWVDGLLMSAQGSAGTGALAEEGARPIFTAEEILREWNLEGPSLQTGEQTEGQSLSAKMAEYLDIKV
ncbi:MAG: DNA-processing protein DprA [Treponema sp.]|nr:DNA-processing protein DprA [Treponema sp.]